MQEAQLKELIKQLIQEVTVPEMPSHSSKQQVGVFATVDEAIVAAKAAQEKYEDLTLEVRRQVVDAIREGMAPYINEIAEATFAETGMGRVADKIAKLQLVIDKTPGVEDLVTEVETGDNGMTLYELSPYGVVGAVTPSTNPVETLICNAIGMLAAGNAIYFSVHPGAKKVSKFAVEKLNVLVEAACGIQNMIVTIEEPSIEAAQAMMQHPDISLLVITGGPGVVHQAMTSGKKTIGAGAGNPPAIVDETANIEKAAKDIVFGAAFDNNILCIAEKSVIAVADIADYLIHQMEKNGAYYLEDDQLIEKLVALTIMENGQPSRNFIGKNANEILRAVGVFVDFDVRLIVMKTTKEHPFVKKEMLMPILPVVAVKDFEEALATALEVEQKLHHTATMHSQNIGRLNKAAKKMQTSIFVKNGPSYAGLGFGGEGTTTFTIATPTGECTTTARTFARRRRCVLTDGFSIR
ncbi:propionaldehyde dehydrogenase [Enterococcus sp. PF1-24]|uniref:aldehyde dehydrogenase family protein n=1 Tax=unclassified Enterococcus TaxID=2608891 RepID=UPI002476AA48|nr:MULTISPECIES: aldehyde dehydrogenase family protein [unclassified Enterococcus]MDH6365446.1 propionaldehyde dehydrogenase [Enterococcus sp. PFB1-1]MDH6402547.1 propionaldehyde dehydrogenase [Enterococcus sp. PF1-24]